jgi:hypothetical protein
MGQDNITLNRKKKHKKRIKEEGRERDKTQVSSKW